MDKYTVDLDQVLNDFEYSELTDQHSKQKTSVPERGNSTFQPTPVTKHSINNVFHSLKEYLNSSINSNGESVEKKSEVNLNGESDNKNSDNKENLGSYTGTSQLGENTKQNKEDNAVIKHLIVEQPSRDAEKTDFDCFSLFDSESIDIRLTRLEKDSDTDHNNIYKDGDNCGILPDKTGNAKDNDKEEDNFVAEPSKESQYFDVEKCSEDVLVNIGESSEEKLITNEEKGAWKEYKVQNTENFVIEPSENFNLTDKDDMEIKGSDGLDREGESSFDSGKEMKDTADHEIEEDPMVEDYSEEKTKDFIEKAVLESEKEQEHENCNKTNEETQLNKAVSGKEAIENHISMEENIEEVPHINADLEDNILTKNEEKSPNQVVGFSEDLEIEESELNKMLEELENEDCGTRMDNDEQDNVLEKDENSVVKEERENIDEIKFVGNIQETEEKNGVSLDEKQCTDLPRECVMERTIIEKQKRNIRKLITKNYEQDKSELEEEPKQDSLSLSRPQNLPLNNESDKEGTTRNIDLIGSPGSTPYNNTYINKTIPSKRNPQHIHDSDTDYSTSASPTFSDCSSESTASTASVEDYPPNDRDKEGDKNVGSETVEGGKNDRGDGDGERGGGLEIRGEGEGGGESVETVQDNSHPQTNHNENVSNPVIVNIENSNENDQNVSEEQGKGDSQDTNVPQQTSATFLDKSWLGKEAPLWIPDSDANACMHCELKFTVIKRRHHCRACGLVLCSKCCNLKFKLEYLDADARVCTKCYDILNKDTNSTSGSDLSPEAGNSPSFRPNPNNPSEYCSTVSPLQQVGQEGAVPPSVMVPVGVLKRKGSNKSKTNKSVMFCDGIAPGSDLTILDQDFNYSQDAKAQKTLEKEPEEVKQTDKTSSDVAPPVKISRNQPKIDPETKCFVPNCETSLPPTITISKTDVTYSECSNSPSVVEMLKNEVLIFAINKNVFVHLRIINMSCCINKQAWCFSTEGLINVGSDEIVVLLEYIEEESFVPKDVFFHVNNVYVDAVKGTSIKELGLSLHNTSTFLDSKNHAGFVYIKPTFQCLENVIQPNEPFLIGILIHRWETPWAKLFPLRLILRLGAEYRYYPSPIISTRHRDSVFVEIGHTIINLLADFRNFTYTLPQIRGLVIHMEDKNTTITIPKNRYDQVMKSINNSSEHILAFAGNFSAEADSHLVCIQDTQGHENAYTTHAINIHNKPRKITGASFIVFNGSLKSSSGLTAKSNIVEDGLMIQVPPEHMEKIRENLRNMKDHTIACGCVNVTSDETVNIVWGDNDVDFNAGIKSPVDLMDLKGVPSIRVHNGKDYVCNSGTRLIRWTEVFILQNGEENPKNQDPVDISKVSESVAKASCHALVKYLDLLVSNSCQKIGIRATLHVENVSYAAGSNGLKLPPIYMRSLDNELVPVLHRLTTNGLGDNAIVLELIFRILNA